MVGNDFQQPGNVCGHPDHVDAVGFRQQGRRALADQEMIIGEDHPKRHSSTLTQRRCAPARRRLASHGIGASTPSAMRLSPSAWSYSQAAPGPRRFVASWNSPIRIVSKENPMNSTAFPVTGRRSGGGLTAKIVGILLSVIGFLTASAAIALIAVFGPAGRLDSGPHPVASVGSAVVLDVTKIQNTDGVANLTGWPVITGSAAGADTKRPFIGIGRSEDVDRYLAGVAIDRVEDFSLRPFELTLSSVPGVRAATPPAAQDFWVASSMSAPDAEIRWRVRDGEYRMVIMNVDGTSGVATAARVQLVLPNAFPLSLGALGIGVLVLGGGIVVLVIGLTARRRQSAY